MEGTIKHIIISFLFIAHILYGQSNFQTGINKNSLLSIKPKNHVVPEQLNQNLIIGNSSSVFWVEPRIRDNYEPPALPIIERSNNDWCGTMPWWEERNSGQRSCDYYGITDDPTIRDTYIPNANTEIKYLRLFIHSFADDSGVNPTITLSDAEAQLYTLNETFSDYKIRFQAWFQIHNDTQYQYMTESEWASAEVKETYAQNPTYYHNIYVTDLDPDWGLLGRSTFPWDSYALTVFGGTIVHKDRFGGPRTFNGTADVTNHVATHELGHALGLWHTHHGVDEVEVCSSCYEGADGYTYAVGDSTDVVGDLCSDTKATPTNFTCADPDTFDCQNNNWINTDVHNFMGYAGDLCWNLNDDGFSSQQSGRMHGWATDKYEGLIVNSEELTLLSTGFEAGLPNDWTVIDDDGDGYQWGFYNDDADFDMSHYGAAGEAVYNYSATNSDYLITPLIEIPSNVASASFSFWAKSHSSSYPEDFVARISTDGTNYTSLGSTTSASSDWTQYSYDISSYIGQSVYLALHCVSTYGWYLMADDFLVSASFNALPLDAEFSASFTTGTAPITIDFTDLSAGNPTSWSWTFGDFGTSILQNPTYTFQSAGLYTISLVVSDGTDSSTETKTDYINIAEPGADTLLTESFEISLPSDWTVIDNDADGYQWSRFSDDGHDGSISMGVDWNSTGNDDWLITPQLNLTSNSTVSFSFWARSLLASYLEDFNVKLAIAGNSVSDFTTTIGAVTSTPYEWTEYSYDLSNYSGQSIYLAVQCVSVNKYYLFVDDFELVCDPILTYSGPVWYVATTGSDASGDGTEANPFATIQTAIDSASNGDTVLVQPGTYTENIIWPETNGIKLISAGDSSNTIIDGGEISSVIYMNPQTATIDTTTLIQGFKITNGSSTSGGGIFLNNAGLILKNSRVCNNSSNNAGAGIYNASSYLLLRNSSVSNNVGGYKGGGIYSSNGSSLFSENSNISNNEANGDGSGIFADNTYLSIKNSQIISNFTEHHLGGGLYNSGCSGILENTHILNNSASQGGGVYLAGGSLDFVDVLVSGNNGDSGGGIRVLGLLAHTLLGNFL